MYGVLRYIASRPAWIRCSLSICLNAPRINAAKPSFVTMVTIGTLYAAQPPVDPFQPLAVACQHSAVVGQRILQT